MDGLLEHLADGAPHSDYMNIRNPVYLSHSAGRYAVKRFRKAQCPIIERLTNSLMMNGRNNGKKLQAVRIVDHAFSIIHLMTDQNPIQVAVDAIVNCGPREDSTRIGSAGTVRRQAVDVSPLRRVNQAIALLTIGAREASFRNVKSIAECLAEELINAAKGSSNSYAIKKKDELERYDHLIAPKTKGQKYPPADFNPQCRQVQSLREIFGSCSGSLQYQKKFESGGEWGMEKGFNGEHMSRRHCYFFSSASFPRFVPVRPGHLY